MRSKLYLKTGFVLLILLLTGTAVQAQFGLLHRKRKVVDTAQKISIYDVDTLVQPVPRQRQLFHDRIDDELKKADVSDGTIDNFIYFSSDDTLLNQMLTEAVLTDVRHMKVMIENMPALAGDATMSNQEKIRYLQAVYDMMLKFNKDVHVDPFYYRRLVTNMREMIIAEHENKLDEFIKNNVNVYTLENGDKLLDGYPQLRAYIYTEMGKQNPKMMIRRLARFANEPFACDIIKAAARVVPNEVFNYASSTNPLFSGAVRRCLDPLVQTIVNITDHSAVPLKAMPFLTDIYHDRLTISQVDSIASDEDIYFQNLVRLKLSGDTLGVSTYSDELGYRGLKYVRNMNDLHEEKDAVRFKCIDGFSPESLYFLMVYGQDEIYTSSFLGTFNRMMERMAPLTGDQLLDKVHRDHFRTFIRMCAGYNTLSTFLASMDEAHRTSIMTDFIAGLENGKQDDLEDAVDVADAFGSISDDKLSAFLEQKVKENYERSYKERSKKGVIIYGLMATLFDGIKSTGNDAQAIAESERLGLPPINVVPFKSLATDSGDVYAQVFFFGDEDGHTAYNSFLGNFRDGKWRITNDKYWTTITSTTGKHVVIYCNLPLQEPDDEEAQKQLCNYLDANNIHPTIVIHRGHSYHLPLTMDRLSKSNKIIVLGSCGGYHNLSVVLDHAPDAHIISSKQTGMMSINEPILKLLFTKVQAGQDINWINMWQELDGYFSARSRKGLLDKFSDYVPPYKNLGAIFIKSYRKLSMEIE
jgi:hypothetical protein